MTAKISNLREQFKRQSREERYARQVLGDLEYSSNVLVSKVDQFDRRVPARGRQSSQASGQKHSSGSKKAVSVQAFALLNVDGLRCGSKRSFADENVCNTI